jgi:chorismate mutase / prephenate dehydratase
MVLVAFQGEQGAYSEEALEEYFKARGMRGTESHPCQSFDEAISMVERGEAHYAFLPIENTLEGTVDEALDVLLPSDLYIVGEMRFKVMHCLIGHEGATVDTVRSVHSHPYAIRQCQDFLRARGFKTHPAHDTAGAVREVRERGNLLEAAIASERAAAVYGMKILQRGIQSREHNYTRFVALSKTEYKTRTSDKDDFLTSIVFGVRHSPAALYDVLGSFASRKINLTKLESRPRVERPWTYSFLVDFEGHREDPEVAAALAELLHHTSHLQILGSYPTWESVKNGAAPSPASP